MNLEQYLLTKLSEECLEIGKEALKIQQFGMYSFNPEDPNMSNKDRLKHELNDLMAIIEMLNTHCDLDYQPCNESIITKIGKVEKFHELSKDLGYIQKQKAP